MRPTPTYALALALAPSGRDWPTVKYCVSDGSQPNRNLFATLTTGVYRCGFAKSQAAYDEAVEGLFGALDRVEEILSKRRYLTGDTFTEADIRLFGESGLG
jgi:glutathione S-transferase